MGKHDDIVEVNYKDHDIHYINKENQKDHLVEFEEGDRTDHFIKAARRSHSSSVRLNVRNNSSVVLAARQLWVKGGEAVNTPGDVSPGHQETLLVTRDTHGNHGTVSYRLGNSNLIMTVMWTSGINCDHYANTLAIGLSDNQNTDKFNTMYFEKQSWFKRQNFLFTSEDLVLKSENFLINAKMIIRPQADVIITVEELELE